MTDIPAEEKVTRRALRHLRKRSAIVNSVESVDHVAHKGLIQSVFFYLFIYFYSVHWQKKQESKAPDKDAIIKATASLSTRHSDRTVTQHNIRDVSKNRE